jgi:hypothetical protein
MERVAFAEVPPGPVTPTERAVAVDRRRAMYLDAFEE